MPKFCIDFVGSVYHTEVIEAADEAEAKAILDELEESDEFWEGRILRALRAKELEGDNIETCDITREDDWPVTLTSDEIAGYASRAAEQDAR